MRRAVAIVVLASACLLSCEAGAQGIFDLFGPDPPQRQVAPRGARDVPRIEKKREAKPKKREAGRAPQEPAKAEAHSAEAPSAPYESQLVRLSEVIGALAFLRDLCGEKDGEEWRAKMSALLDADAPSGPRHDKYVAAFNRGFRGYELTYRACTPNARVATARYLDEAASISRDLTYRFGSP
jgi:uncharacterized protein (TIGR02301 family)